MQKSYDPKENKLYIDCMNIRKTLSKIKDLGISNDSIYTKVM